METLAVSHLTFSYPEVGEKVLDDLCFTVSAGEFVTLCGPSGCGKSTVLRHLRTALTPHGHREGSILFEGGALEEMDLREQSARIGFVQQSPDNQIVTDKVWHELAFGLESLGFDTPTIRKRVAEMASFFGIQTWFHKNVSDLSGGQKQLLNLAAIMVMQPDILILDEPTSQLDPIAAADFLATVGKINRELGTTILITEHRLEEVFPLSNRVLVMDKGHLIADDTPLTVGKQLRDKGHDMFLAMPTPIRVWASVPDGGDCPVTVREGRQWLEQYAAAHELCALPPEQIPPHSGEIAAELEEVWFKYEQNLPDVVKGLSLQVHYGEFFAILGGNGTGKTTTLSLLDGANRPYRGKVRLDGRLLEDISNPFDGLLGVLPQNPQALFVAKTVREDLFEMFSGRRIPKEQQERKVASVMRLCRLEKLMERHPYDLSGGEQQRAALAKVLLLEPRILLLDEPTKGLDAEFKQVFAAIMRDLLRHNVAVIMVSHDIEFCARYAHRCAMFFDGSVVTENTPRPFFSGNSFYTTSANRMARRIEPGAVTAEDIMTVCGGTVPPDSMPPSDDDLDLWKRDEERPKKRDKSGKLPFWKKILAGFSLLLLLASCGHALELWDILKFFPAGFAEWEYAKYVLVIVPFILLAFAVSDRSARTLDYVQVSRDKRKLHKRTIAAAVMILLLIPVTIYIGVFYLGDKKYLFISLLVMLECMLPFFLVFEGRKPQARELIIISVLCALAVAGRMAFAFLPEFKPVMALIIITGVAFGGETGFLVGAMSMFLSNIFFSQGPWTPWQMFSMGIIGFLAGVLFRKGLLRRTRASLCTFGFFAALIIYGGIMNPASALMWQRSINWSILMAYYATGLPVDIVHGIATVLFLYLCAEPMLEKLDRIKVKYGLVE